MWKVKGRCSTTAVSVASDLDVFVRSGETGEKPGDYAGSSKDFIIYVF